MTAYVHPSAIVDEGAVLADGVKVWHFSHVMPGARLGEGTMIGQNCFVGAGVQIGARCRLQNNVSVYEGVTLEEGVFCGPSAVFTNDLTPRALHPKHGVRVDTLVRRGASIGANATIVCGTTIGRWAMVAAGAVVTKDVEDHALMAGIPARRIGWSCVCGETLAFSDRIAGCACGRQFESHNEQITEVTGSAGRPQS